MAGLLSALLLFPLKTPTQFPFLPWIGCFHHVLIVSPSAEGGTEKWGDAT